MSEVSATPALEVVLCTYNNGAMLDGVLSTLACQRLVETASWSCLVVDNNCTDDTPNVIGRHILARAIPDLRSVREPKQGLTSARLRGVRSTTAQWIAFVDDDCFLQSDWIAQAIAFAESHSWVGAFGGRVVLDWEAEPPHYVRAYGYSFAEQDHGNSQHAVKFLAGAGLVVNRLALSACGWVDAPLLADRVGEKLVSGGDVEIALRIAGIGRELWYVPQCVLNHRIPARRFSPRYLININRNLGISQALADALVSEGSLSSWLFESISKVAKRTLGLAQVTFDVVRKRKTSVELLIQASFKLGQLQGIWRVVTMSPSRRRQLLGRARPHWPRDLSGPPSGGMSRFLAWKIVHVSVREPLPDLTAEPGWGGLFVVFWCDGIPVGQVSIPALLLPLASSQLAATLPRLIAPAVANRLLPASFRAPLPVHSRKQTPQEPPDLTLLLELNRPLEACSRTTLSRRTEPTAKVAPCVSVVICTRNRPEVLRKCLSSIRGLSPQPNEIIVVDNDPSSGLTEAVTSAFPEVRYIPEPRRGLSAARNTGARNSRGEIIAFTDDDVEVHPGWVGAIQGVFRDEGIIATTGLVLPAELATPAQYAFQGDSLGWGWGYRALDFDDNFFRSMKHVGVPVWRLGAGANMAFRREAFERVGFFDERLGAGTSGCSEDSELWYRLLAAGYRCRYEPAAVVFHNHRSDWNELREQTYNYMRGHVAALLFQFDRYGHWGNIYRAFVALPFYFLKLAFRYLKRSVGRLIRQSGDETPFLPLLEQIRGAIAGYGYYLQHRRHPADPMMRPACARSLSQSDGSATVGHKTSLSTFLSHNPFESPLTFGFFYREKMRAIHRVAPDLPFREILEVGGGRSGLTRLLYPAARVTNLDMDSTFADAPCNLQEGVRFVCGDATRLEFEPRSFDAVTMFDVLEHIPDHDRAVSEALRVLRPGGYLLISTPNEHWRFPYYRFMKKWCPSEEEMFAEWGHVRRGYSLEQLGKLIGIPCERSATFISPLTVLCHDVAFSRIPARLRRAICLALSPITWIGYAIHTSGSSGTETASAWRKPAEIS